MSNEKVVNNAATAADPPVSNPPVSNPPAVMTPETMLDELRAMRPQIPDYVQLAVTEAQSRRVVASLNPDFAQAAINAVGASPKVEGVVGYSAEELQVIAETCARWTPVEDELRAMLGGVSSANLTRRHTLGQAVLLTYSVSKKLVKQPEHAGLLPHLAQMRRTNRLGRRKPVAKPPAPAPSPEPAPSPAPNTAPASHD